jgi:hypothetical protein
LDEQVTQRWANPYHIKLQEREKNLEGGGEKDDFMIKN